MPVTPGYVPGLGACLEPLVAMVTNPTGVGGYEGTFAFHTFGHQVFFNWSNIDCLTTTEMNYINAFIRNE